MVAVPNQFIRTVVFLCTEETDGATQKTVPRATGFFVRVNDIDYVVTARHCVEEAFAYEYIYIRINRES